MLTDDTDTFKLEEQNSPKFLNFEISGYEFSVNDSHYLNLLFNIVYVNHICTSVVELSKNTLTQGLVRNFREDTAYVGERAHRGFLRQY